MDIVEWLQNASSEHNMYRCEEAADEIEGLTERVVVLRKVVQDQLNEVDRLRGALRKIAYYHGDTNEMFWWQYMREIARDTLEGKE